METAQVVSFPDFIRILDKTKAMNRYHPIAKIITRKEKAVSFNSLRSNFTIKQCFYSPKLPSLLFRLMEYLVAHHITKSHQFTPI